MYIATIDIVIIMFRLCFYNVNCAEENVKRMYSACQYELNYHVHVCSYNHAIPIQ